MTDTKDLSPYNTLLDTAELAAAKFLADVEQARPDDPAVAAVANTIAEHLALGAPFVGLPWAILEGRLFDAICHVDDPHRIDPYAAMDIAAAILRHCPWDARGAHVEKWQARIKEARQVTGRGGRPDSLKGGAL